MLSALAAGKTKGFDEKKEKEERAAEWKKRYVRRNCVKQGMIPVYTPQEIAAHKAVQKAQTENRKNTETFDPAAHHVKGVGLSYFKKFLVRSGLRYTQFDMPHPCPKCDDGEAWEANLPLMSLYFLALRTTSTDRSAIWDGLYIGDETGPWKEI